MAENKSALLSAATETQGKEPNIGLNLHDVPEGVKSQEELFQEYKVNTFTSFQLLWHAQVLAYSRTLISHNKNFIKCHRIPFADFISLTRNADTRRAYYKNIITCGNSFLCPVCAARIMGQRSGEIRQAVHQWLAEDQKNTCYMFTFTFSHSLNDRLDFLLDVFGKALVAFWENGSVKRLLKHSGRGGRITAKEIQFSLKNGFHPHVHVLLFCQKTLFPVDALSQYWLNALASVGLSGLSDIAFDLVEARSAECYLTKISSEMALGNLKKGRSSGHYSPMGLLAESMDEQEWASERFIELFLASKKIHPLRWSPGLKKRFGVGEFSDEEIAQGAADPSPDFIHFLAERFKMLSASDKSLLRIYSADGDFEAAAALLRRFDIEALPGDFDFSVLTEGNC